MGKSSCSAKLGQLRSNGEDVLLILAVKNSHPIRDVRGILASWCALPRSCETAQVQFLLLFCATIIYWELARERATRIHKKVKVVRAFFLARVQKVYKRVFE